MAEDDRPWRKGRSRDDDDEDDRPRRKRRDEDDDERDEDRPRRRRRDDEDDDEWDEYDRGRGRGRRERLPRDVLRSIAGAQKGIIMCILGYLCCIPVMVLAPEDMRIFVAIPIGLLGLTATVFVFLLATRVYSTAAGVVLGLLTLVPCIGLIVLLIINGKATNVLKENGVHVGFLGASTSDI